MNEGHHSDNNPARELIPWYVNGTLSDLEREAVEALLYRSEEARQDAAFLESVGEEIRSDPLPAFSELGWRRLRGTIEAEAPLRKWWRPGMAAAAAMVIALQTGVLLQNDRLEETRLLSNSPIIASGEYWLVQIMFAEQSSWHSLMTLIEEADASLVDGPSPLGLVRLAVNKNSQRFSGTEDLLSWLEQQPQVLHLALEGE